MSNVSQYLREGESVQHTPAVAVDAGNLINIGSVCGFAPRDIAASALGTLGITGVLRVPYIGGIVCNLGDNVWWDDDATPYGGAATGACTCNAAVGDWWVGTLVAPTTATGATADVALNRVNPNLPAWQDKTHFTVAADTSLVAATHSGGVMHVTADAGFDTVILTPAGVVGMDYIVQNDDADGILELTVGPNGVEIYEGANLTNANGEDSYLTKATSKRGDYLHLVCNVNATSWRCVAKRGIWLPA